MLPGSTLFELSDAPAKTSSASWNGRCLGSTGTRLLGCPVAESRGACGRTLRSSGPPSSQSRP